MAQTVEQLQKKYDALKKVSAIIDHAATEISQLPDIDDTRLYDEIVRYVRNVDDMLRDTGKLLTAARIDQGSKQTLQDLQQQKQAVLTTDRPSL
ncbi:MAG: hypothetical protein WBL50_16225 [Candidatus Acidiferrum sp.]